MYELCKKQQEQSVIKTLTLKSTMLCCDFKFDQQLFLVDIGFVSSSKKEPCTSTNLNNIPEVNPVDILNKIQKVVFIGIEFDVSGNRFK